MDALNDCINNDQLTDFEKTILLCRKHGWSYAQIQQILGNPSKKLIRATLLKVAPELIDMDCNHNKLKAEPTKSYEKRMLNWLNTHTWTPETEEETFVFWLTDNQLVMKGEYVYGKSKFRDLDETTQQQVYNEIINYNGV